MSSIIAILAAILQLGNLQFKALRLNNMDATECSSVEGLQSAGAEPEAGGGRAVARR